MHSNLVSPPDYIETVLIIEPTELQLVECADTLKTNATPYDVYYYKLDMDNTEWLSKVYRRADRVLSPGPLNLDFLEDSAFMTDNGEKIEFFGPSQKYSKPAEYFAK